jgi:group I intron endonuclease
MNKISGIYEIRNKINNDRYIGSSNNIKYRFDQHKKLLNKRAHPNCHIQRAWNKYGANSFEFNLLFECKKEFLLIEEQKLLDKNPAYNIAKYAQAFHKGLKHSKKTKEKLSRISSEKNIGRIVSEKTRQKISESLKGHPVSEESKYKNSLSHIGKTTWNKGIPFSKESKQKMSKSHKGKRLSDEAKQKLSKSIIGHPGYMLGKHHSEEAKQKIGIASKGNKYAHNYKMRALERKL